MPETHPTVRIVDVITQTNHHPPTQRTTYQGAAEGLVAAGLVTREQLASVGKSNVRKTRGEDGRCTEIRRLAKEWRVIHEHPTGEPPLVPDPFAPTSSSHHHSLDYNATCAVTAALNEPIEVSAYVRAETASTSYTGAREQLIAAGLAVPSMFPATGRRSRRARMDSPSEQGDWRLNAAPYGRWTIWYNHERFTLPKEVRREAAEYRRFCALKQQRGWRDDGQVA